MWVCNVNYEIFGSKKPGFSHDRSNGDRVVLDGA